MKRPTKRVHKYFRLDSAKLRRARRVLHAKTETETTDRALDLVIEEHQKDRLIPFEALTTLKHR